MKLKLGVLTSFCSVCLLAGGLTFGVGSASAYSFPLWNGYTADPNNSITGAGTRFEDDDLDFVIDNGDGVVSIGDVLISGIQFATALHLDIFGSEITADTTDLAIGNDALVALAQIKVTAYDSVLDVFLFGQVDDDTPMVQVWSGGNINFDPFGDPTLAEMEAAIQDGTHLWDFSVTADPDTFWSYGSSQGAAGLSYATVAGSPASFTAGVVNFALNQVGGDDIFNPLWNGIPLGLFGDGLVDLTGTGTIQGGQGKFNGAFARSDVDVFVNPVPEPATMTLFGLGLLGLGFMGRRRSRN